MDIRPFPMCCGCLGCARRRLPTRPRECGATGRVVLATAAASGTPVAIKYLSDELRAETADLAAFRAEARILATLDSAHVVRLWEYVEEPAGAAIVMELVDGVSLRTLLHEQ